MLKKTIITSTFIALIIFITAVIFLLMDVEPEQKILTHELDKKILNGK